MAEERTPEDATIFAAYRFNREELGKIATDLSQKVQELHEKEDRKKDVASQIKAEIDAVNSELNRLANCHRNGLEYRNIKCELSFDFEASKRTYTRKDTGEVIKEEELRQADYQTDAFGGEK